MASTILKPSTIAFFLWTFTCCVSLNPYFRLNCGGYSTSNLVSDRTTGYLTRWGTSYSKSVSGTVSLPQGVSKKYGAGYKSERWSQRSFGYTAHGIEPGSYTCTFHFAETSSYFAGQGRRVFSVRVNNRHSSDIDVWKSSGRRMYRGYTVSLRNILVSSSINSNYQERLKISFLKVKGDPMISAITCEQQSAPKVRTKFAVNCGGIPKGSYVSDMDEYNKPSWLERWGPTRRSDDPKYLFPSDWSDLAKEVLRSERFAVKPTKYFGYKVRNLSPGNWQCALLFSETHHNYSGERVFYATVNGDRKRVDVLRLAGKYKFAGVTFSNIDVTNSISITLQRLRGDPMISGFSCYKKSNWSRFSRIL